MGCGRLLRFRWRQPSIGIRRNVSHSLLLGVLTSFVPKRKTEPKHVTTLQAKLGATIKHFRSRLGVTQEELAFRSGMHRTYIADIERGGRNITLRSIAQLALALHVTVRALLAKAEADLEAEIANTGVLAESAMGEIVLVEDDPADVELTLRALKRAKMANPIKVVRDGAEALAYLFATGEYEGRSGAPLPQLILLDLILPKVAGLEVLRRIKSHPLTGSIPVVVVSASKEDNNIAECARLGAENFLIKPVVFENFCKVTARLQLRWALLNTVEPDLAGSNP